MSEFKWTDDTVKEMIWRKLPVPDYYCSNLQKCLDEYRQSKQQTQSNKDWEIVDEIKPRIEDCFMNYSISLEQAQKEGVLKIKSVKRLSDGEVFTVGDNEVHGKIIGFEIDNTRQGGMIVNIENWATTISAAKKAKQPLFRTDDGKNLYEGDRMCLLSTNRWITSYPVAACANPFRGEDYEFKYFSTEEAAKEYITYNKPCLSLIDIKEWIEDYFDFPNGISVEKLKPLAQQKINNK